MPPPPQRASERGENCKLHRAIPSLPTGELGHGSCAHLQPRQPADASGERSLYRNKRSHWRRWSPDPAAEAAKPRKRPGAKATIVTIVVGGGIGGDDNGGGGGDGRHGTLVRSFAKRGGEGEEGGEGGRGKCCSGGGCSHCSGRAVTTLLFLPSSAPLGVSGDFTGEPARVSSSESALLPSSPAAGTGTQNNEARRA